MKKIRFSFILVLTLILISINSFYYIASKKELEQNQDEKIELIFNNVRNSVERSNKAQDYFNLFLAKELQLSSIAIQNALPHHIEDVKNEELKALSKKLGLQGITLFVKQDGDIVGAKSSSPDQIGLKTKHWAKGLWYSMFKQLLEKHDVALVSGFGEELDNFWSGPMDTSSANPSIISKWGYYNDGTTDYLINPYIDNKLIANFHKNAGVDKTISRAMENDPYLLEISIINSEALKNGEKTTRNTGVVWLSDRLTVFGDYKYKHQDDKKNVEKTIKIRKETNDIQTIQGKKVLKSYFSLDFRNGDNLNDDLVIIISTDYEEIQKELHQRIFQTLIISIIGFSAGFIILYWTIRIINKKERTIFNIQDMYSGHVESLFKTIKEYKHDFNHHLYTISGLVDLNMYEELNEYVKKALKIQTSLTDIVDVNIPALSGLLQAKVGEANTKNIGFEYHFEQMERIQLDMMKVTNLVRSIGNILDNAFHAVEENDFDKRKVTVIGKYSNGSLSFQIYNNGPKIPEDSLEKIFSDGFTTRGGRGGNGIGLSSTKKIIESYKGTISVTSDDEWTKFLITIPVSRGEMLEETLERTLSGGKRKK